MGWDNPPVPWRELQRRLSWGTGEAADDAEADQSPPRPVTRLPALAPAAFGATPAYPVLLAAAFMFGLGNVATNIANATMSMVHTPSALVGRVMASRQVFIAVTKIVATIAFGWVADRAGASLALVTLGLVSGAGVAAVWSSLTKQRPRALPDSVPDTAA